MNDASIDEEDFSDFMSRIDAVGEIILPCPALGRELYRAKIGGSGAKN